MNRFEQRAEYAAKLKPVAGDDSFLEAGFVADYCRDHPEADAEVLITRRLSGEPLQYVLGEWDFMGLTFHTDSRALIPRPETETVCQAALERIREGSSVLDLCCGSGCIGIAIAKRKNIHLISADLSEEALALTRENAKLLGVSLNAVRSDLFEQVEGTFDCIVSNPPYLSGEEVQNMDQSLRFEPEMALYGGEDGLDFYRRIKDSYERFLNPGGWLVLEIGYCQEADILMLFDNAEIIRDYGGRPRCAAVHKI